MYICQVQLLEGSQEPVIAPLRVSVLLKLSQWGLLELSCFQFKPIPNYGTTDVGLPFQ